MNESTIENLLIEFLQAQGYSYQHGSETSPQATPQLRSSRDEVLLAPLLKAQLKRINPTASDSALQEVYQKLTHLEGSDLISRNEQFHYRLRDGIKVESFSNGETINEQIFLVDMHHIENNDFRVINQFTIKENNQEKRCDVVIFVNGLPLVLCELKNPLDEKADLQRAYTQIHNYQTAIPSLFHYNGLCVISDGMLARVSTFSAPFSRYLAWKSGASPLTPLLKEKGILSEKQGINLADPALYPLLLEKAKEMRNHPTWAEQILWEALRNNQVWVKFRQQHIIDRFIVDFCCLSASLIIEIDGSVHDDQVEADLERTEILESYWYKVIRFTNDEVINSLDKVIQKIKSEISSPFRGLGGSRYSELETLATHMLAPSVLLDLILNYTVFETQEQKDQKTWQIFTVKLKKTAAYHQYYAVQKAIHATLQAVNGDHKIGVVRHTQGSGKSLSMVFYAGKLITHPALKNPTLLVITDRNDLDDQLFQTFSQSRSLLRQSPQQAESREHLKELLKVAGGGVIFSTIQKFSPEEGNVFETLSERENIIVIADEAHRSQYGFKAKAVQKDQKSDLRYGNAKYLRDALPNASFIGFTGTPIEKADKSTRGVFGDEIDIYDIRQAVEDGATVPISYESRLIKLWVDQQVLEQIDQEIENFDWVSPSDKDAIKSRLAQVEALVWNPKRLELLAQDFVAHFEQRQAVFEGKVMFVAMSRGVLVRLYDQIVALRPDWAQQGKIKVIMTASSDDPEEFQPHFTTSQQRKDLAIAFKNPKDPFQIALVCDMWLTGFDAPCLHTLYLDKKMQGAALMQAIARVNRVYKDKPWGLIVDYIGIAQDLRDAMAVYTQSGGTGLAVHQKQENIKEFLSKYEVVEQMFHGSDWKDYFLVSSEQEKFRILSWSCDRILQSEDLKQRFLKEFTQLNKLFTLAMPSPEAERLRDELAFFQAIKVSLIKISRSRGENIALETTIRQILDWAVAHGEVVDIFQSVGMNKPQVDLLSDDFLLEVKNMKYKNLALELLKRILNDEISMRQTTNLAQAKKFSEMMTGVFKKYTNAQIDTAQVLQELCDIAEHLRLEDNSAKQLGLTPEEFAFYTVLSQNQSTQFLQDEKMKELIHAIVTRVRKSATWLWLKKSDIQAELRLQVKKILMQYGYPPDLARMEADKVLEQSELLAEQIALNS